MTLEERINQLTPRQRQVVDQIVSSLLLAQSANEQGSEEEVDLQELLDLYWAEAYVDSPPEPDLNELRRLVQYGVAQAQKNITQRAYDRAWLLTFLCMQADLEMAFYFFTADQSYRRNAINFFHELQRLLSKEPQTYDVESALKHAQTMENRLKNIYKDRGPETATQSLHLIKDYADPISLSAAVFKSRLNQH